MADDGGEYTTGNEAADELHPFYNKAGPAHMPPFIFVSYLKSTREHSFSTGTARSKCSRTQTPAKPTGTR